MIADIAELVHPGSIISSVLLGLMIGAAYGYELAPTLRPRYPVTLWSIGLAFIVLITMFTAFDVGAGQMAIAFGIARGLLWTLLCACIPLGRLLHGRIQKR